MNTFLTPEGLADLKTRVRLSVFQTASADPAWVVGTLLPLAREANLHLTLRMTGDHHRYTTTSGDFDLAAWKAMLTRWEGAGIQPWIDDGTLIGHMLLDDITNFEGRDPDGDDLDEMARASEEVFPGLMTYVRQRASRLPERRYRWLDAAVNQYLAKDGSVIAFARTEAQAARQRGLGVINGLNIADGGDGSSGQPGWTSGKWAMSADEIRRYGLVLARVRTCRMFLAWEYDGADRWSDGSIGADYFRRPDLEAALRDVGEAVASHPPVRW